MLKKFHVEFYGIILDSFETMPYKLCHFLTLTDYIQCVPILYSNDCEPLLQSRYACLYNLEPNFMPCLALHHFFASSNLLIDSHHFVTFLNKQEAIVASAVMIRCISWIPNRSNLIIRFEQGDSWCWLHCDRFCVTISLITVARYMVFQSLFSSKQ